MPVKSNRGRARIISRTNKQKIVAQVGTNRSDALILKTHESDFEMVDLLRSKMIKFLNKDSVQTLIQGER
jgi:hypothetical protein